MAKWSTPWYQCDLWGLCVYWVHLFPGRIAAQKNWGVKIYSCATHAWLSWYVHEIAWSRTHQTSAHLCTNLIHNPPPFAAYFILSLSLMFINCIRQWLLSDSPSFATGLSPTSTPAWSAPPTGSSSDLQKIETSPLSNPTLTTTTSPRGGFR